MGKEKTTTRIKCVIIGDPKVGKTELVHTFVERERLIERPRHLELSDGNVENNKYPKKPDIPYKYTQTQFDNFQIDYRKNRRSYNISMFDTAGAEDFDKIRKLSYPLTDVFIICFSMNIPGSFRNVYERWIPDIEDYNMPVIIVGCKSDMAHDGIGSGDRIKDELIEKKLKGYLNNKNYKYIKCSAVEKECIEDVLLKIVEVKENYDETVEREKRWRRPGFFKRLMAYICCRHVPI